MTLYTSSFLVYNEKCYTRHNEVYCEWNRSAGSERVCSKLGGGMAPAPVSVTDTVVEPLEQEYDEYGNDLLEYLNRLANCTPNELTVYLDFDPELQCFALDNLQANEPETEQYFYHPDHLGSSSFISDAAGQGYQHLQYMPFGETFVSQKINTWSTPYQFSAKEKDDETGFSYFGARYYNSDISIWLSVDPMASMYASITPYSYCVNNPLNYADPNGEWVKKRITRYYSDENGYVRKHWYNVFKKTTKREVELTVHNAKLYYHSGTMPDGSKPTQKQLQKIASDIQNELVSSFDGSESVVNGITTIIHYKFAKNIEVIDNLRKVIISGSRSDDLFLLVNNPSDYSDEFCGGMASAGGNLMILQFEMMDEWERENGTNRNFFAATHEGAHERTSIGNEGHWAGGWLASHVSQTPTGKGTDYQIYQMGRKGGRNKGAGGLNGAYTRIFNETRSRKNTD